MIVAAGGISKGSQIISSLSLGADGVLLGTAFLPCFETTYPDHQKEAIINASGMHYSHNLVFTIVIIIVINNYEDGSKTVRTNAFDIASGLE